MALSAGAASALMDGKSIHTYIYIYIYIYISYVLHFPNHIGRTKVQRINLDCCSRISVYLLYVASQAYHFIKVANRDIVDIAVDSRRFHKVLELTHQVCNETRMKCPYYFDIEAEANSELQTYINEASSSEGFFSCTSRTNTEADYSAGNYTFTSSELHSNSDTSHSRSGVSLGQEPGQFV